MKKLILIHGMFIIMKNHIEKTIKKFMMVRLFLIFLMMDFLKIFHILKKKTNIIQ